MEKRGGWKTSRMTPLPKGGFGPPSYGTFSTPLKCQCSVFPVEKSRQSRPEALFEWSRIFREGAFSGTFSSPHTFCTRPYHGPRFVGKRKVKNIKNLVGHPTPHTVCPMDMSQSHVPSVPQTFCPLNWNFHINRPKCPGCPWDVPNFSWDASGAFRPPNSFM